MTIENSFKKYVTLFFGMFAITSILFIGLMTAGFGLLLLPFFYQRKTSSSIQPESKQPEITAIDADFKRVDNPLE